MYFLRSILNVSKFEIQKIRHTECIVNTNWFSVDKPIQQGGWFGSSACAVDSHRVSNLVPGSASCYPRPLIWQSCKTNKLTSIFYYHNCHFDFTLFKISTKKPNNVNVENMSIRDRKDRLKFFLFQNSSLLLQTIICYYFFIFNNFKTMKCKKEARGRCERRRKKIGSKEKLNKAFCELT